MGRRRFREALSWRAGCLGQLGFLSTSSPVLPKNISRFSTTISCGAFGVPVSSSPSDYYFYYYYYYYYYYYPRQRAAARAAAPSTPDERPEFPLAVAVACGTRD